MRFFVNSTALLTELVPHERKIGWEEDTSVAFIIYKGYLDLWSDNATTGMAIDSQHEIVAHLPLDKTLQALCQIDSQEITLDLHEFSPSRIYATRLIDENKPKREPICFTLEASSATPLQSAASGIA